MPGRPNVDLVFVSDLHLGADTPDKSAAYAASFSRFLAYLRSCAATERSSYRLVLLGDCLDFTKVRLFHRHQTWTSTESTLWILGEIARQQPSFFRTLGEFAADGLPIDVVPGNHDIDLVRVPAQRRFRQLVEQASGCSGVGAQISFHPWIYHVPGVVYAEHGHQHHDINSFATVLQPYRPGDDERLDLPLAAHLGTSGRVGAGRWLRDRALAAASMLRQAVTMSLPGRGRRRLKYREEALRPYAAELGLDHATLVAIDQLCEASVVSIAGRLVRARFADRGGSERPPRQRQYLPRAAGAIHGVLASAGASVPYYVFGHTHAAEELPLAPQASVPMYLNTGTWSPYVRPGVERRPSSPLLTCVHIHAAHGADPSGEVLVWDDDRDVVQPLSKT